ncbi:MAG: hypothetical protein RIQ79_40, partial [Verrucomicrobiota bacterium]
MKKWLLLAALFAVGWLWLHEPAAKWKGLPAARDPQQDTLQLPAPFHSGDYTITPLARYALKAVVLSRSRYRYDASAPLSPLDLALAWGPMSDAAVINELNISQSGRW